MYYNTHFKKICWTERFKYFITHMSNMILDKKITNIMGLFTKNYDRRIYGRGVAKKLNMNQKTVSNILKRLEKENILKFSTEGKNKYYFLNKNNENIKEIIKIVEINRKIDFLNKYDKLKELFYKLESKSKGILIIFGSYANFSANESSDLDVLVIEKIYEIEDLEKLYNVKINMIEIDKKKFDKNDVLIKEIIKNHIILKGNEEFIELIW